MFPDRSDLPEIGQTLQNKLPFDFFGDYLLFHVVNLLFNAFVWANNTKAQKLSFLKF